MDRGKFLVIGFVVMCFNSLYQYSWNALEPLLITGFKASVVQVALGFALFSIFSSLFQPVGGHFADKNGPKKVGIIAQCCPHWVSWEPTHPTIFTTSMCFGPWAALVRAYSMA
ncbi:hypothetical protein [Vulcanisaeta souniana]|uniref:hypothetical protein n=1 Tax=Vulcanisaeta souniana TaxID=164452 RepID=UPI000ACCE95D|nr:hypothetical protein [Vulcanisaeta souniana]